MNPYQLLKEFNILYKSYEQNHPSNNVPEDIKNIRIHLMEEECREVAEAIKENNLEHIAKEIADLMYVLYGTVRTYGLQDHFDAIFLEVHESNMSKVDKESGLLLDDSGKVIKSKNYRKADMLSILKEYLESSTDSL